MAGCRCWLADGWPDASVAVADGWLDDGVSSGGRGPDDSDVAGCRDVVLSGIYLRARFTSFLAAATQN